MHWERESEWSPAETRVASKLKRVGKFYVFLREIRDELLDEAFESRLAAAYRPRGQAPAPPGLLAMVTLLQAYTQTGDADAVVTASMDRRWQLVLGTLGAEDAPFSQGTLWRFRQRMIEHDLDKALVDRTVELARQRGGFGPQKLRAALDSSPLLGAGRVEDIWNLIGRAMRHVVRAASRVTAVPPSDIIEAATLTVLEGPSVKVALAVNWDHPDERYEALQRLVEQAERLQEWVEEHASDDAARPPLSDALKDLDLVLTQDLEPDPDGPGTTRIRRGVARDRLPSLGDREMRHGRKSKQKPFTGYKRHIVRLVGTPLILDGLVLPANQAEQTAAEPLLAAARQHGEVEALYIDRGYLGSNVVSLFARSAGELHCKPWPLRNRGRFTKEDFKLDLARHQATCPAGRTASFSRNGRTARFGRGCTPCPLRAKCTTAANGRSISIHKDEDLLISLRERRSDPVQREELRRRVAVEHGLAKVGAVQGRRARYKGARKNTYDLRRTIAVVNLQALPEPPVTLAA